MTGDLTMRVEAHHLATELFGKESEKSINFASRLVDVYNRTQGKDFLLIHNPGGWGNKELKNTQQWERSILDGISSLIERAGYTSLLIQYFRTGNHWLELIRDVKEQLSFFDTKAEVMAAWLEFLTRHSNNLKVILIGVSMGAAFSNAVMQRTNQNNQIYSIELGMFSIRRSRRVVTEKILTIDSNGVVPDATMAWNIVDMAKAFSAAPLRWILYRLKGNPVKFSYCINSPGHEYDWRYPKVQQQISDFLGVNFGNKR